MVNFCNFKNNVHISVETNLKVQNKQMKGLEEVRTNYRNPLEL